MRRLIPAVLCLAVLSAAQAIPIRDIRVNNSQGEPVLLNQTVSFQGVVTEAGHFGGWGPAFVQDSTGGVAVYGSPVSGMSIGDSVTVSGKVENYNGLVEITTPSVTKVGTSGAPTPKPFELDWVALIDTAAGYVENEGWLVAFDSIQIQHTSGETFVGNRNYTISDPRSNQGEMRVDGDASEIVGMTIPDGWIRLVGVIGQYKFAAPYFGGYQVMPRIAADLGIEVQFTTIADAIVDADNDGKPDRRGQSVNVTGVVTAPTGVFDSTRTDIYVQDATAGVNVFSFTLTRTELGDSVVVAGKVDWYRGKTEVSDASITIVAHGHALPEPVVLKCREAGTEAYEGMLVKFVDVTTDAFMLEGNANYPVGDTTGSIDMRIDADTDIPGLICVNDTFSLTGIKGQYASDTTKPLQGYQIMPRYRTDFSRSATGGLPLRTIAEVQRPGPDGVTPRLLDSLVRVRGVISGPARVFTSGTAKSLYIQDTTLGINLYGCSYPSGDEAFLDSIGVEWEVIATVTEYNGLTELANGTMSVTDTVLRPPVPRLLPFNTGLSENMESNLLTMVGDIIQAPYASGPGYNMTVKNGNAAVALRINDAAGISTRALNKGRRIRITGIVGQYDNSPPYNSGYQLMPRFQSDIFDTSSAFPPAAQLILDTIAPNPFCRELGQVAGIQLNAPTTGYRITVTVFDLEGREVRELLRDAPGGYYDLKWDGTDNLARPKPAGIYLVNVKASRNDGKTETLSRPVVLAAKLN